MIKFLRINNNFINLESVKTFKAVKCGEKSVVIWIEYNNKEEESFHISNTNNSTLVANALHQCILNTHGYNCTNLDAVLEEIIEISGDE